MREIIERAAKAMSERDVSVLKVFLTKEGLLHRFSEFRDQLLPWEAMSEVSRQDYASRVEAVLDAISSPTEEMIGAGVFKHSGTGNGPDDAAADVSKIWRAMLWEARKP